MEAGYSPDYAIAGIDNGGRTYSNFLNSSNNGYGFDALYQAFNATDVYKRQRRRICRIRKESWEPCRDWPMLTRKKRRKSAIRL